MSYTHLKLYVWIFISPAPYSRMYTNFSLLSLLDLNSRNSMLTNLLFKDSVYQIAIFILQIHWKDTEITHITYVNRITSRQVWTLWRANSYTVAVSLYVVDAMKYSLLLQRILHRNLFFIHIRIDKRDQHTFSQFWCRFDFSPLHQTQRFYGWHFGWGFFFLYLLDYYILIQCDWHIECFMKDFVNIFALHLLHN